MNWENKHTTNLMVLSLWLCFWSQSLIGQQVLAIQDTLKVRQLQARAQELYAQGQYSQALQEADAAYQLALTIDDEQGKADARYLEGQVWTQQKDLDKALEAYIAAAETYQSHQAMRQASTVYHQLGRLLFAYQYYRKAIAYLNKSLSLQSDNAQAVQMLIAEAYWKGKDYPAAQKQAVQVLQQYPKLDEAQRLQLLNIAVNSAVQLKGYPMAIEYQKQIIQLHQQQQQPLATGMAYNNLGTIYRNDNQPEAAIEALQRALNIFQSELKSASATEKCIIYQNIAATYSILEDTRSAEKYYNLALESAKVSKQVIQEANIKNLLAAQALITNKPATAIRWAKQSLEITETSPLITLDQRIDSYRILAMAYELSGDLRNAQLYSQQQLVLEKEREQKQQAAQQAQIQAQLEIERKESALRTRLASTAQQEAALRRATLEQEKQAQSLKLQQQELDLLKRNKELQQAELNRQQLERERVENLLKITQQNALAERQKQEVDRQKQEVEKQRLRADKERAERQQQAQELQVSKAEQEKKDIQLQQEKTRTFYGALVMALGAVLLLLVAYGLLQARRLAKKLKRQNHEIENQRQEILTQNEELYQSQEELQAQRDFIEQKNIEVSRANEVLQARDRQISSSIQAAVTIQQAVLPYAEKINLILGQHLLIFKPKDVVSGDFFWLNQTPEQQNILIVADCTGHGVPGAFMTLIGNTLLDKIVRVWDVTEPAQILSRLHDEIRIVLRQETTGNNNGMDAAVFTWQALDDQTFHCVFAGAKSDAYYFLPNAPETLHILYATRKAIGGVQSESKFFEDQTISLPKGTTIYLGSDGFADQNDSKRKKFGYKRLQETLTKIHTLPFAQQAEILEEALQKHQQSEAQRDDILLIGFRI
jgi:serine phosphatase RsbU (regulator of sigma subunit)/tetratricopeptide (TPR) repeat protein